MKSYIALLLFLTSILLYSQEGDLKVTMDTQVMQEEQLIWDSRQEYQLILNEPVNIRLNGNNFKMIVRLTCNPLLGDKVLFIVQSETLMQTSDEMVDFYSNLRTVTVSPGEPLLYYPLGSDYEQAPGEALLRLVFNLSLQDSVSNAVMEE